MCSHEGCRAFVGPDNHEDIVTFDYGHLTKAASRFVTRRIVAPVVLEASGGIQPEGSIP
jgi:hypothetical protein